MIGHYIRSWDIIMQNMHEMWSLIYSRAMRTVTEVDNLQGFPPTGDEDETMVTA